MYEILQGPHARGLSVLRVGRLPEAPLSLTSINMPRPHLADPSTTAARIAAGSSQACRT